MLLTFLHQYFLKICQPNPDSISNDIERKLQFKRNKTFLAMKSVLATLMTLFIIFIKKPTVPDCFFVAFVYSIIMLFCLMCRSYPFAFKVFYTFMCGAVGPLIIYMDKQGVYGGWISVQAFPPLLLYITGSQILYIIQVLIQLSSLHFIYKAEMLSVLNFATPEEHIRRLMAATTFAVVMNTIMMVSINLSLKSTYEDELAIAEYKRKVLEKKKNFVLSFSHEIRNLITSLTGNIQLSLLEKVPMKVKDCLENAEIGASLLLQLINNILDTGNVEVAELETNPEPQIIHNTFEKMWNVCSYLLKAKGIQGKLQISKDIPKVLKIDHARLMQIFFNLIENSVKFTHKGFVDIKVEWRRDSTLKDDDVFSPYPFDDDNEGLFEKDQAVSILGNNNTTIGLDKKKWSSEGYQNYAENNFGVLKISVIDTGCGIHSENISKVFEKFSSQTFGTKNCDKLYTNIGLFITKELCNKMGGDVKVFSKLHRGTAFTVCLPAQQIFHHPQAIPMDLPSFTTFAKTQQFTAMIVDDLNFNITILSHFLSKLGIDSQLIQTAKDGREAYYKYIDSVLSGRAYDIVTMDVEMPVMNGKEAAQKIREFEREKGVKPCLLIMVSGNCCESEIKECLIGKDGRVVADYFLKKPATFDDVFNIVSKHYSLNQHHE